MRRTIGEMRAGDKGYTVPWAYGDWGPNEHELSLNLSYWVDPEPGGTVSMEITCVGPGKYEFVPETRDRYP